MTSRGGIAHVRDMPIPAANRAKLSTHQCFPNIAGCGTSTRGECRAAARRSIRRTPQQQVQSSLRLACVSGNCRQRPTVRPARNLRMMTRRMVCAGGHHQVNLGCARAAPQLRMLRRRSSARVDGGDDLHLRVHLLPSLRRRPLNGYVSQLRRQLVPPADPTCSPA